MKTVLLLIGGYFAIGMFLQLATWLLLPLAGIIGPLVIVAFIVGLIALGRAVTR
jgi:hypothetical protein